LKSCTRQCTTLVLLGCSGLRVPIHMHTTSISIAILISLSDFRVSGDGRQQIAPAGYLLYYLRVTIVSGILLLPVLVLHSL